LSIGDGDPGDPLGAPYGIDDRAHRLASVFGHRVGERALQRVAQGGRAILEYAPLILSPVPDGHRATQSG
jgi:hypothetical protein